MSRFYLITSIVDIYFKFEYSQWLLVILPSAIFFLTIIGSLICSFSWFSRHLKFWAGIYLPVSQGEISGHELRSIPNTQIFACQIMNIARCVCPWRSVHSLLLLHARQVLFGVQVLSSRRALHSAGWSWNGVREKYYWAGWSWSWWLE